MKQENPRRVTIAYVRAVLNGFDFVKSEECVRIHQMEDAPDNNQGIAMGRGITRG